MSRALVPKNQIMLARAKIVPYLTPQEVTDLANAAGQNKKGKRNCLKKERNSLLIKVLFEVGLRISEALRVAPKDIEKHHNGFALRVLGKGKKVRLVAIPVALVHFLESYAYRARIGLNDRFFNINRKQGWAIIKEAAAKAGFTKRVYPHLLRHSDAIERLRQTGNPKALQHHLGHSSIVMTMRYLSTLTQEDSLRIQQGVTFNES